MKKLVSIRLAFTAAAASVRANTPLFATKQTFVCIHTRVCCLCAVRAQLSSTIVSCLFSLFSQ
jgi:hypothetical protein